MIINKKQENAKCLLKKIPIPALLKIYIIIYFSAFFVNTNIKFVVLSTNHLTYLLIYVTIGQSVTIIFVN